MATPREWANACLAQARSDLLGAKAMGTASPSTLAMVLQMVFEKLAKAALIRKDPALLDTFRTSHKAASRLLHTLRFDKEVARRLGGTKIWGDVLSLVNDLERAHPQLGQPHDPQLEYPWERLDGAIQWPARDLGIARMLGNVRDGTMLARIYRFADLLDKNFDTMFP